MMQDSLFKQETTASVEDGVVKSSIVAPGARLKNARVAAGLSQVDAGKLLRLSQVKIIALESDNYPALGALTFIRGYLRAYANLLNLDADHIIAEFNALGIEDQKANLEFIEPVKRHFSVGDKLMRWVTIAIVAGILSLLFVWWSSHNDPFEIASEVITKPPTVATTNSINQPSEPPPHAMPMEPVAPTIPINEEPLLEHTN